MAVRDTLMLEAIQQAVRSETGDTAVTLTAETTAADVAGWDSLAHGRIMLTLEVELGVRIDIEKTYSATNVGELVSILREALGTAAR